MNRKDPSEWSPSYAAKNRSKRSNGEPPYWFIYRDKQRDLFEFPISDSSRLTWFRLKQFLKNRDREGYLVDGSCVCLQILWCLLVF